MKEREKDAPRGDRTHTFCYSGRYPQPVRLEETSNSRLASVCHISDANKDDNNIATHLSCSAKIQLINDREGRLATFNVLSEINSLYIICSTIFELSICHFTTEIVIWYYYGK